MTYRLKGTLSIAFLAVSFLFSNPQDVFAADAGLAEKANAFAAYIESAPVSEFFGASDIFPDTGTTEYGFMDYAFADYDTDGEYELCIVGASASANQLISILDEENGAVSCRFRGWGYIDGIYPASDSNPSMLIIFEGNSAGEGVYHFRISGYDPEWGFHPLGESAMGMTGINDFAVDSQNNPIGFSDFSDLHHRFSENCMKITAVTKGTLGNCSASELAAALRSIVSDTAYILPRSDTESVNEEDIAGFTLQKINYAKNEIYARHGRKFKSQELADYFNAQSWYSGTIEPDAFEESSLNEVEAKNIAYLQSIEFADGVGYVLDQEGYDITQVTDTLSKDVSTDEPVSSEASQADITGSGTTYTADQAVAAVQQYGQQQFSNQGGPYYIVFSFLENSSTCVVWYHWPTGFTGKYTADLNTGDVTQTGPYNSPDVPGSLALTTQYSFNIADYI